MESTARLRRQRLAHLLEHLIRPAVYRRLVPLSVEMSILNGEPIPPANAGGLAFQPSRVGDGWGGAWATCWFRATGRIPDDFHGSHVVALVDLGYRSQPGFGGEALVFAHGRPTQGVNSRHRSVEIAPTAEGGSEVELLIEAAANPVAEEGPLEGPLLMPDYAGTAVYRRGRFDLAVVDDEMKDVLYDWTVLLELADSLGLEERRSAEILTLLDDVAHTLDPRDLAGTLIRRRDDWLPLLARPTQSSHLVTAAGHAHIDSAWLWPVRETRRKCARTISTQLGLMERYPEYVFVCSQAQQHAWLEHDHPALFAEMKARVADGRLEPVGSMWVEPDTNLPSGESLVRQLVLGKRYFLDRYGVETTDCWLPDAFGYTGSLPQILRAANVSRFLTQKLSWNEVNPFPHHTFWWEGIDGSRVLAHCPPANTYNGEFTVGQLVGAEARFAQHGVSSGSLYAFGYGDGGGGPTEEMLERARRMASLDPLPRVQLAGSNAFFTSLEEEIARYDEEQADRLARSHASPTAHGRGPGGLPVWTGELYLEKHRGVQTTQARGKLGNRLSERLLREAELWAAVALPGDDEKEARDLLARAWEKVLLQQFHDILPGSSIHWVHDDALASYAEVAGLTESVIARAVGQLTQRLASRASDGVDRAGSVVVLNAATTGRDEVVEVDTASLGFGSDASAVRDENGSLRPVQQLGNGRALFRAAVPGSGWAVVDFCRRPDPPVSPGEAVAVDGLTIRNDLVSVTLDESGRLTSLRDHLLGREIAAEPLNVFQLHHDLPRAFDAWDVDEGTFERALDQIPVDTIEVGEVGPVRASLRVVRPIGEASRLSQEIRLSAGSRLVEFVTEVDWQERHSFLKVAFPVAVKASHATYEIQFGHLERPTHANTSWDAAKFEVPAQRWAALSEPGLGVALLNDCKHGYDIRRNVMRLSLLRGPGWPDPDADAGPHRFCYGILPFDPGAGPAEVVAAAEAFNIPLRSVASGAGGGEATGSFLALEGAMLAAVKRSDDGTGELIVRFYEHNGTHGTAILEPAETIVSAERVDLLERRMCDVPVEAGRVSLSLRPFELVSLRLRR